MVNRLELDWIIEQDHLIERVPSKLGLKEVCVTPENCGLYFGMGGGNKMLNKGLPLDVLSMVLIGEKTRRAMKTKASILIANEITKTNPFGEERIERVMSTEQEVMSALVEVFGFDRWNVVNQTTLFMDSKHRQFVHFANQRLPLIYEKLFGKKTNHVYHFAIEMADIHHFVGKGGIKLGWYLPPSLNSPHPMDEVKFDKQYELLVPDSHVSYLYVKGGITLVPDEKGMLQRSVPYISYDNKSRILLSPDENVETKWENAETAWKKTASGHMGPAIKRHYSSIVRLYADLVDERILEINGIPKRLQFIIDSLYDKRHSLKEVYRDGFNEQ